MKETELRIGNLTQDTEGRTVEVCINRLIAYYQAPTLSKQNEVFIPIPLTDDWLERFGFNRIPESNRFYLDDDNTPQTIYIDLDEKDTQFGSNEEYDVNPCMHVHQLQNLYHALTGEELPIKEPA